jgi:hypothetical protein
MVGLWGMSEEVGSLYLGTGEQDVFLGRELTRDRDYSEDTISAADRAVRELLERSHHRATQLLTEHRVALDLAQHYSTTKRSIRNRSSNSSKWQMAACRVMATRRTPANDPHLFLSLHYLAVFVLTPMSCQRRRRHDDRLSDEHTTGGIPGGEWRSALPAGRTYILA